MRILVDIFCLNNGASLAFVLIISLASFRSRDVFCYTHAAYKVIAATLGTPATAVVLDLSGNSPLKIHKFSFVYQPRLVIY